MRMHDVAVAPDGTIYAITPDSLLKFNPMTGLLFEVGSLHLSGRANALASDRLGRLFGATESGSLFEVNSSTGQARMIGGFGPEILSEGDLAFAPDGTLFGTSQTSLLLRIDVTTGQATVIGDLKFKQLEGLAFDADGRLYGSSTDATLISIDTSAGTAVQVGVFNNSVHMNGLAMPPVVNLRATTSGLTLALAWDALGSTLSYVLEAGSGPGLADLHKSDIGNVTTLTATAPPGTYFLRMRANGHRRGASLERGAGDARQRSLCIPVDPHGLHGVGQAQHADSRVECDAGSQLAIISRPVLDQGWPTPTAATSVQVRRWNSIWPAFHDCCITFGFVQSQAVGSARIRSKSCSIGDESYLMSSKRKLAGWTNWTPCSISTASSSIGIRSFLPPHSGIGV